MSGNDRDDSVAELVHDHLQSLPAVQITMVTTQRIKFYFWPSRIVEFIDRKATFRCYLRYDGKYWHLKRYHLPVNYQMKIFKLFWTKYRFAVTDDNILEIISKIYQYLCRWSKAQAAWRLNRFQRYKSGEEDVEIDSVDEKLFLTKSERGERRKKIKAILRRMKVPP